MKQKLLTRHRAEKNMILADTTEAMNRYAALIEQYVNAPWMRPAEAESLADAEGKTKLKEFATNGSSSSTPTKRSANLRCSIRTCGPTLSRTEGRAGHGRRSGHPLGHRSQFVKRAKDSPDAALAAVMRREAGQDLLAIHRAEKNMILETDQTEMEKQVKQIEDQQGAIDRSPGRWKSAPTPNEQAKLAQFRTAWTKFLDVHRRSVRPRSRTATRKPPNSRSGRAARKADACEAI